METGTLVKQLAILELTLKTLGGTVATSSVGLQTKIDKASSDLGAALAESTGHLVKSLNEASVAAKVAAEATGRYTRQLVFATGALVVATVLLVLVTAFHK